MTPGIPVGGLCAACAGRLGRQAARIGRWAALATTLPLGVYLALRLPADPTVRWVGAAAVAVWYLLTSVIARRVAWEWLC
jgi:hypothetical protein